MVRSITCCTKDQPTKTPLFRINTDEIGTFCRLRRHSREYPNNLLLCLSSILRTRALERIGVTHEGVNVKHSGEEATDTLVEVQLGKKSLSAQGSPVKTSE